MVVSKIVGTHIKFPISVCDLALLRRKLVKSRHTIQLNCCMIASVFLIESGFRKSIYARDIDQYQWHTRRIAQGVF